MTMMTAYRFKYRKPGESFWWVDLKMTAYNDEKGARELAAAWNRKDRGRWEWTYEICLPESIDHPANR